MILSLDFVYEEWNFDDVKQSNWQDQVPRLEGSLYVGKNLTCKDDIISKTKCLFNNNLFNKVVQLEILI